MCTRTDAHNTKNTKAFNKAMQYCPNCNKEFNDDKQFCSNCGCPLIEKLDSESYFLVLNGAQAGPYTIAQLTEFMCLGVMTQNTYVWKEGMPDWDFARNVDKVKQLFTATPPPLHRSSKESLKMRLGKMTAHILRTKRRLTASLPTCAGKSRGRLILKP